MPSCTLILGIETSCDETAAAVVSRDAAGRGQILSNIVLSQLKDHAPYGGVVPEIAARAHVNHLDRLIAQAMAEAGLNYDDLDGIAATAGPGLLGGVIVGLTMAKAIALASAKPLIAVNHLEGHALTARLLQDVKFPYLLLLISGGHTQFQLVEGVGKYHRLGTTIDDALGEAFDKVAKLLGLGYPGGPAGRGAGPARQPAALRFPAAAEGPEGLQFLVLRPQDRGARSRQRPGNIDRSGRGRRLRLVRGGRGRDHGRPAEDGRPPVPRRPS